MLIRDPHGILVQHDIYSPIPYSTDAGDSASRVALGALAGSYPETQALKLWTELNRHPYDKIWSDSKLMSRDQVVCLVAGLSVIQGPFYEKLRSSGFPGYFVNKDFLNFDVRIMLKKALNKKLNVIDYVLGYPMTVVSILWACYIKPEHELNQIFAQTMIVGPWAVRLIKKLHPDWEENLKTYYNGWRDQAELGAMLIEKIKSL